MNMKNRTTAALVAVAILASSTASATATVRLITGANIKDRSITGRDIATGSISRAHLTPTARPASSGVTGYEIVTTDGTDVGTVTATCPAGKVAVGGGHNATYAQDLDGAVFRSDPTRDGRGWQVGVRYLHAFSPEPAGSHFVRAFAVCVNGAT